MKIAIFGDSFGDDHINWKDQNRWLDIGPSWVDYLRQFHEVDNFCLGGSSLYFSKRKIDNTDISVYDKVIFLITNAQRRFQLWPGDIPEYGSNWNFMDVENRMRHKQNPEVIPYLTAMDMFFKYIYNESDEHFHQLMIDDIKRKCPTGFMIDVAQGSVIGDNGSRELAHFAGRTYRELFSEDFMDARKCHMCEENNLILGKYIHYCLTNSLHPIFKKNMFTTPTRPFEYYFRKS